jgi:hypothetical protein
MKYFYLTVILNLFFHPNVYAIDSYENDDSLEQASIIDIGDIIGQRHDFHQQGDQDWIKFYAQSNINIPYNFLVWKQQSRANVVITLYDHLGQFISSEAVPDERIEFSFRPPHDGIYYLMIQNYDHNSFGNDTSYTVLIYHDLNQLNGKIVGTIKDAVTGQTINQPLVNTTSQNRGPQIASRHGVFIMSHPIGTYDLIFSAEGYIPLTQQITVLERLSGAEFLGDILLQPEITQIEPEEAQLSTTTGLLIVNNVILIGSEQRYDLRLKSINNSNTHFSVENIELTNMTTESTQSFDNNTLLLHLPSVTVDGEKHGPLLLRLLINSEILALQFKSLNFSDQPETARFNVFDSSLILPVVKYPNNVTKSLALKWSGDEQLHFIVENSIRIETPTINEFYPRFNDNNELQIPNLWLNENTTGNAIMKLVNSEPETLTVIDFQINQ